MSQNVGDQPCSPPELLMNGKYICKSKPKNGSQRDVPFPSNSTCRVKCDHSYSIPIHLRPLSVIKCQNGAWTSTDIDFCYKRRPRRQRLTAIASKKLSNWNVPNANVQIMSKNIHFLSMKKKKSVTPILFWITIATACIPFIFGVINAALINNRKNMK